MLAALSISLCSCDEDNPVIGGDNPIEDANGQQYSVITKLWQVKMRRELLIPFSAYVMQVNDRNYLYMIRSRFNHDLRVGDLITYSIDSYCPNEISRINGYDLSDDGEAAEQNDGSGGLGYLVATDPIETRIKSIFSMTIKYSISFWPADTWFIETTDGNLVFVKKSKVNVILAPGDRIVYSKYMLYDEILTLKKL